MSSLNSVNPSSVVIISVSMNSVNPCPVVNTVSDDSVVVGLADVVTPSISMTEGGDGTVVTSSVDSSAGDCVVVRISVSFT